MDSIAFQQWATVLSGYFTLHTHTHTVTHTHTHTHSLSLSLSPTLTLTHTHIVHRAARIVYHAIYTNLDTVQNSTKSTSLFLYALLVSTTKYAHT